MKLRSSTIIAITGFASMNIVLAAGTDTVIPTAHPEDRYASMIGRSPFSLATPKAEPEAPSFAANLYVTGIGKQGDMDVVAIASRDPKQSTFSLFGAGDSYQGITLVSVQWDDEVGRSKVTIKKGANTGSIGFNEQVLKSPISVTPPKGKGGAPDGKSTVPLPRPNVKTPTTGASTPRVRPRRTIRRPGQN